MFINALKLCAHLFWVWKKSGLQKIRHSEAIFINHDGVPTICKVTGVTKVRERTEKYIGKYSTFL